jgi:ribonucleoside-diphosphate reductase alpha subunit
VCLLKHTIVIDVISTIKDGITAQELDEHASRLCINKCNEDNNYGILAARIAISNHQKNTLNSFSQTVKFLYNNSDKSGKQVPLLTEDFYNYVMANSDELDLYIDYIRDFNLSYFGHMTLFDAYYMIGRNNGAILRERTQHLYMRIAVALHFKNNDMNMIKKTYDILSLNGGYVSHATPTMYNAGAVNGQLASCFLTGMLDSMDEDNGIPHLWTHCAKISKRAGGIGICLTNIRGKGSRIRGTNGESDGIIPLCKVLNDISRYVNQGGKRKGSFSVYIEPWHIDIEEFVELKKNHGNEDERARDLFLALWIPDLFMKRLIYAIKNKTPVKWSLMCPDSSHKEGYPRLYDVYGEEFERIYEEYEADHLYIRQIDDIRDLWKEILSAQQESGVPYILYKDHINRKNNQSNLGVIRTSNLCAEIVEFSNHEEHAVCNLASLALQRFINYNELMQPVYDFKKLYEVAYLTTINLDRVIDITFYPTDLTKRSNLRHRPIGLGVQGLADVFIIMKMPFDSPEAAKLNKQIFETIYFIFSKSSL